MRLPGSVTQTPENLVANKLISLGKKEKYLNGYFGKEGMHQAIFHEIKVQFKKGFLKYTVNICHVAIEEQSYALCTGLHH